MNDIFTTKETFKTYAKVEIRVMVGNDEVRTKTVRIPLPSAYAVCVDSIQADCKLVCERYVTVLDGTNVKYCNMHGEVLPPTTTIR